MRVAGRLCEIVWLQKVFNFFLNNNALKVGKEAQAK
jgi:hypothetical protein